MIQLKNETESLIQCGAGASQNCELAVKAMLPNRRAGFRACPFRGLPSPSGKVRNECGHRFAKLESFVTGRLESLPYDFGDARHFIVALSEL